MTTPDPAMTTARDIIDIAAQAMYTQDAQDSMSSADWDDLSEDERDDWRRIAEAGIAALRDAKRLLPEHVNAVVVATTEAGRGVHRACGVGQSWWRSPVGG